MAQAAAEAGEAVEGVADNAAEARRWIAAWKDKAGSAVSEAAESAKETVSR